MRIGLTRSDDRKVVPVIVIVWILLVIMGIWLPSHIDDVGAILTEILIFGSLFAVVSYYILDRSRTLRERPFMRLIRACLEVCGTVLNDGMRTVGVGLQIVGTLILALCLAGLGLVIVFAIVKWAFEELAR